MLRLRLAVQCADQRAAQVAAMRWALASEVRCVEAAVVGQPPAAVEDVEVGRADAPVGAGDGLGLVDQIGEDVAAPQRLGRDVRGRLVGDGIDRQRP